MVPSKRVLHQTVTMLQLSPGTVLIIIPTTPATPMQTYSDQSGQLNLSGFLIHKLEILVTDS